MVYLNIQVDCYNNELGLFVQCRCRTTQSPEYCNRLVRRKGRLICNETVWRRGLYAVHYKHVAHF
jgi:hypothetical protein